MAGRYTCSTRAFELGNGPDHDHVVVSGQKEREQEQVRRQAVNEVRPTVLRRHFVSDPSSRSATQDVPVSALRASGRGLLTAKNNKRRQKEF